MGTLILVIIVIFVFLRNVWATLIPAVTVPLSLVGTFGAMHMLGYSLDNLSLMALTLAVGLIVDDAIVMSENVFRQRLAAIPGIGDGACRAALLDRAKPVIFYPGVSNWLIICDRARKSM